MKEEFLKFCKGVVYLVRHGPGSVERLIEREVEIQDNINAVERLEVEIQEIQNNINMMEDCLMNCNDLLDLLSELDSSVTIYNDDIGET